MSESIEIYRYSRLAKRKPFTPIPRELCLMDQELILSTENFFEEHPEISCQTRKEVMEALRNGDLTKCEIRKEIEDFHFRNTLSKYVKNDIVKFFDPSRLRNLFISFCGEVDIESPENWLKRMEDEYYDYCDFNGDAIEIFSSVSEKNLSQYNDGAFQEEFSVRIEIFEDDNEKPLLISLYLTKGQRDSTTSGGAEMLVSIKDLKREKEDQLLASIESGAGLMESAYALNDPGGRGF